jgi:hypothetical protein
VWKFREKPVFFWDFARLDGEILTSVPRQNTTSSTGRHHDEFIEITRLLYLPCSDRLAAGAASIHHVSRQMNTISVWCYFAAAMVLFTR